MLGGGLGRLGATISGSGACIAQVRELSNMSVMEEKRDDGLGRQRAVNEGDFGEHALFV